MRVDAPVIAALVRLLDPEFGYPGLLLGGPRESARLFHDDVTLVAETLSRLIEAN